MQSADVTTLEAATPEELASAAFAILYVYSYTRWLSIHVDKEEDSTHKIIKELLTVLHDKSWTAIILNKKVGSRRQV